MIWLWIWLSGLVFSLLVVLPIASWKGWMDWKHVNEDNGWVIVMTAILWPIAITCIVVWQFVEFNKALESKGEEYRQRQLRETDAKALFSEGRNLPVVEND